MTSRRTKIRWSLLALLVAYLREATTDTTKFTLVDGVAGSYPFTQQVWTFTLGSYVYQITANELADPFLPAGATIQFSVERPDFSKAMPQVYEVDVRILLRFAKTFSGESVCQQIAAKIDQALYRSGGRCSIKDYEVDPTTDTGGYFTWQVVPRGSWEFTVPSTGIEQMELRFTAQYHQPSSEW